MHYAEYREFMQELAHKKKLLTQTISKKKIEHAKYREHHREFMRLNKRQDELTKELIELVPKEF